MRVRIALFLALLAGCTRDDWRDRRDASPDVLPDASPDLSPDASPDASPDVSPDASAALRVTQVLAAPNLTFARTDDGGVFAVGLDAGAFDGAERSSRNTFTRVQGLDGAAEISLASRTPAVLCARSASGTVTCKQGSADAFPIAGLADARQIAGRCALRATGEVACWTVAAGAAEPVAGLSDVTAIAGNGSLQCALLRGGGVSCWGEVGAVLDDPPSERVASRPEAVPRVTTAAAIGVGTLSACAALAAGGVVCWGRRSAIDFGPANVNVPATPIPGARSMRAVSSNAGLRDDGAVMVWATGPTGTRGDGTYGVSASAVEVPSLRAEALAQGDTAQHLCAIDGSGSLRCWGLDEAGELARGGGFQRAPLPVLANPAEDADPAALDRVTDVMVGATASCALREGGSVWCWGSEEEGRLADGILGRPPPWRLTPTQVAGLGGIAQLVSFGSTVRDTFAAVLGDGTVRTWGTGQRGGLGDGSSAARATPTAPTGLTGVAKLAAGLSHLCALGLDGSVRCWGPGDSGELGDGMMRDAATPVTVTNLGPARDLALGPSVSVALLRDGSMRLWGIADSLLPTGGPRATPAALPALAGATQLAAVMPHDWRQLCALHSDGRVSCLGDRLSARNAWVDVGLSDVTQIAGSPAAIGCARHANGTVSCWGVNRNACVGDPQLPQTEDYVTPTLVRLDDGTPLDHVARVRPGIGLTCAVRDDGTLWCWGANTNALLARGAAPYVARPSRALGL